MRQRRWIELFSYYDCEIRYHPDKANVVEHELSRKERLKPRRVRAMSMTIYPGLKAKILEAPGEASTDLKAPAKLLRGLDAQFEWRDDGGIYFMDRIWIPLIRDVKTLIMDEAHTSRYSVHPSANKMYYDLRDLYWWSGMKKDIARLTKSAYFLPIHKDYKMEKLERIYINKIVARHDVPQLGSAVVNWSKLLYKETTNKDYADQRRLKTAEKKTARKKSYADKRHKPLDFNIGDRVTLKVSPWKGVVCFDRKGKLAPRYVGPFEIVKRVGQYSLVLRLPSGAYSSIHNTFHGATKH
ncbi:putative reverse transcriptase domain-containing protein [Tanacetum coccineum]